MLAVTHAIRRKIESVAPDEELLLANRDALELARAIVGKLPRWTSPPPFPSCPTDAVARIAWIWRGHGLGDPPGFVLRVGASLGQTAGQIAGAWTAVLASHVIVPGARGIVHPRATTKLRVLLAVKAS